MSPIVEYKVKPFSVVCDECCEPIGGEDYGGAILYETRAEAEAQILEWNWTLDGERVICDACAEEDS